MSQRGVRNLQSQAVLEATSQENHHHQKRKTTRGKQHRNGRTVAVAKNLVLPVLKENPKEQDLTAQKAHKDQTPTKRPKEAVTHLQNRVNINKVHQKIITKSINRRNNGKTIIIKTLINPITMI